MPDLFYGRERDRGTRAPVQLALYGRAHRRARPAQPAAADTAARARPAAPRDADRRPRLSRARSPASRPRLRHLDPARPRDARRGTAGPRRRVSDERSRRRALRRALGDLARVARLRRCGNRRGTRDAEYILREDFPVFSRYVTPQDCVPRWELLAHGDVTIVIGGVRLAPGDWIVGDRDGLVIVPGEQVNEILAEAEEKVATEDTIRDAVRRGTLPLQAYEQYGTF